jgi:5-methylcytosine-specific restriction endonuclease McrA
MAGDWIKKRKALPRALRRKILERDNRSCRFCGFSGNPPPFGRYMGARLHIDHIIPFSKCGSDDESNLMVLCSVCNMEKSNKVLGDYHGR